MLRKHLPANAESAEVVVPAVCAFDSQRDCDGNAATVGEDVAFRAKLSTICRIGTGKAPPLGAFTEALSREHQRA